ncbi:MAG: pyridine nucleotide-disulfide oxidoreductase [Thermoplasmata archaeon]|nr:MAG: pyridine nucleotide-disulfide oxidoreductase [Thermoplasmata archaeon]
MRDAVVIGGGPSGLAAAIGLREKGLDVLLIEREEELGGILNQCIHDGFGTKILKKALSGPEFAGYLMEKALSLGVEAITETYVKSVEDRGEYKEIITISPKGIEEIRARAIVYALGARERTPFEIKIGGTRPAGVYTAGMVQRLLNLYGILPGKRVLIVGGGDVGMIVARHLYLEGAESILVVFPEEFFAGLPRNVQQCILDFGIPYRPRTTVKEIVGRDRVKGAILARVDERWNPIPGTEEFYPCDTIVFSVGLIPYASNLEEIGARIDPRTRGPEVNEFFETTVRGTFAVGNLVQIFDYVDDAVETAYIASEGVRKYLEDERRLERPVRISPGELVGPIAPQRVEWDDSRDVIVFFRPRIEAENVKIQVKSPNGKILKEYFRRYVRPSTMERIEIPRDILEGLDEVIVDVSRH